MIVEVRTYTTLPGLRQRFLDLFETRTRPTSVLVEMDDEAVAGLASAANEERGTS